METENLAVGEAGNDFDVGDHYEEYMEEDGEDEECEEPENELKKELSTPKKKEGPESIRRNMIMRDYGTELQLCQKNYLKCEEIWDSLMTSYNLKDIKDDMNEMRECLHLYMENRTRQAFLIWESFEDNMDASHSLAAQHISGLIRLTEIFNERIRDLETEFRSYLETKKKKCFDEEASEAQKSKKEQENIYTLVAWQAERGELESIRKQNALDSILLELNSKHWTDMEKMTNELEENLNWILVVLQTQLCTQLYFGKDKIEAYEKLKAVDKASLATIWKDMRYMKKIRRQIKKLRFKLKWGNAESKVEHSKAECAQVFAQYNKMKIVLEKQIDDDSKRLRHLTMISAAALENLRTIWEKRYRILTLKRLCGKHEEDEERKTRRASEYLPLQYSKGPLKMNVFWQHFGKIQASKEALEEELQGLKEENKTLKETLKEVFQIFSHERQQIVL